MHPASQYFAQHLHSHPVDALVDELRRVGYDDMTISQAWLEVSNAQTAAVAADGGSTRPWLPQGAVPIQSAVQPGTVAATPGRQRSSTLLVAGLVLVVALVGGMFFLRQHDAGGDDALSTRISENTGVSKQQAKQSLQSLGGAKVTGDLPSGWSRMRDGLWSNSRNGATVSVVVTDLPSSIADLSLAEIASASEQEAHRLNPTIDMGTEGTDERMLGRTSYRVSGTVNGVRITQDFVRSGRKLVVVSVGGPTKGAYADALDLTGQLEPTA